MNKNDRKELQKALQFIEDAKGIIETLKDDEQAKFDNMHDLLNFGTRTVTFFQSCQLNCQYHDHHHTCQI